MKVQISDDAELDLADGFWFYENQDDGLGSEFRDSMKRDIRSLEVHGGTHSRKHGYCRKVCNKFPFCIFYRLESEFLLTVVAVFHQRRQGNVEPARVTKAFLNSCQFVFVFHLSVCESRTQPRSWTSPKSLFQRQL